MNNLQLYGWNEELFQQKQNSNFRAFIHGRVVVTHKTCYEVVSETGHYTCELTGNMLYGRDISEYPCTGDWVIFQSTDIDKGIILDMLPRKKTLYRLKNGSVSEKQSIASYVDKAFIVQSLDENFNVRRIERFILQTVNEGILPVLVLTKTDLGFDKKEIESELKTHFASNTCFLYEYRIKREYCHASGIHLYWRNNCFYRHVRCREKHINQCSLWTTGFGNGYN